MESQTQRRASNDVMTNSRRRSSITRGIMNSSPLTECLRKYHFELFSSSERWCLAGDVASTWPVDAGGLAPPARCAGAGLRLDTARRIAPAQAAAARKHRADRLARCYLRKRCGVNAFYFTVRRWDKCLLSAPISPNSSANGER